MQLCLLSEGSDVGGKGYRHKTRRLGATPRTKAADGSGADGRGDVVIAGGDVGGKRPKGVEGRLIAPLRLHSGSTPIHNYISCTRLDAMLAP